MHFSATYLLLSHHLSGYRHIREHIGIANIREILEVSLEYNAEKGLLGRLATNLPCFEQQSVGQGGLSHNATKVFSV